VALGTGGGVAAAPEGVGADPEVSGEGEPGRVPVAVVAGEVAVVAGEVARAEAGGVVGGAAVVAVVSLEVAGDGAERATEGGSSVAAQARAVMMKRRGRGGARVSRGTGYF